MGNEYKTVPIQPTEDMWGGFAGYLMLWLDLNRRPTPASLYNHLEDRGKTPPEWLTKELRDKQSDHVVSKGTRVTLIYKAMLHDFKGIE